MTVSKLTENEIILLKLIERSPDIGDGWRQVSGSLWPLIAKQSHPDLTELDAANKRIRFTPEGQTVMRYAV
ncbi:hypothetical protein A8B82_14835 [Sulfitobacter sp. EhC04]|nr:hypothetical protein A8B82_14835 [Sulfitobacter sp. EhC04]